MPNVTIKPSSIQGQGVFAQRPFHKGEVILQIDDSHIITDETTLTPQDWEVNFKLPIELQLEYLPHLDEWFIQQHQTKIEALKHNS